MEFWLIFTSWHGWNVTILNLNFGSLYVCNILIFFCFQDLLAHDLIGCCFYLKMFNYFVLSKLKCYCAKHLHFYCLLCFYSEIYSGKPVWPDLFSCKDLECLQWASRASVTFFRSKLGLLGWWLSPRLGFLLYNTHMPHTVDKNCNNCSKTSYE